MSLFSREQRQFGGGRSVTQRKHFEIAKSLRCEIPGAGSEGSRLAVVLPAPLERMNKAFSDYRSWRSRLVNFHFGHTHIRKLVRSRIVWPLHVCYQSPLQGQSVRLIGNVYYAVRDHLRLIPKPLRTQIGLPSRDLLAEFYPIHAKTDGKRLSYGSRHDVYTPNPTCRRGNFPIAPNLLLSIGAAFARHSLASSQFLVVVQITDGDRGTAENVLLHAHSPLHESNHSLDYNHH
ncbi:hypothetical protein QBC45DRAFT_135323 [Copromyces sp. CBS 386.78]|nr:hypothetical protein QBC45DRAFT_135323 [Copromyces sp. CBS 386.78]